jgi:hypothetical protein
MNTPLHETADDPRAYRQEQRSASYARALCALLVRATGCYDEPAIAAEEDARARASMLAHFASIARDARSKWGARWRPSALLLRALARRNATWADVEAQLEDDDAEGHDEACTCSACDRARSRYARQAREREAATCGGISDFGREVLGW